MFKSIRHGLFAALAGFTVLICVCYTGLALIISYVTEDMLVDRLLEREADAITAHFRLHQEIKAPSLDLIAVYRSTEALPPVVRAQVGAGRQRGEVFTDTGQHYHLRTLVLEAGARRERLYLLADVVPLLVVSKLVREVGGVLMLVALGLIGLALLLAYLLSRRLVAPLQVLAEEVRGLQPDAVIGFSARRRPDEIGYLADRLGVTIAELQAALRREHAFTRDVSHELRTPLTVMHNVLGQAASRPLGQDDAAQLRAGLDEITQTIDVLFALARAEHIGSAVFDLRGCIEDALLHLLPDWEGDEEGHAERLVLDLPERLQVCGNRHLSMLLTSNCLGNALFHGGPGSQLRLSFVDGVLGIANTVDPDRAGAIQGFLHGQNLLRRIANAMGWGLQFHAGATLYRVDIIPLRPD
jgi:signal transduction histidine kinase